MLDNLKVARALKSMALVAMAIGLLFSLIPTTATAQAGKARIVKSSSRSTAAQPPRIDYSRFSHKTHVAQQKLTCDSCHKFPTRNWKDVRKAEAAFADVAEFPEHGACLNCHRQQFFARERPAPTICANCHIAVSPRETTRFLFPSLGDVSDLDRKRRDFVSEFAVNFPHDKHLDVIGANLSPARDGNVRFIRAAFQKEKKEESDPRLCVICHHTYQPQGDATEEYVTKPPRNLGDAFWLKKGTFKTTPNSHAPCSSCHNTDAGIEPAPSKCEVCHKLLPAASQGVDFDPKLAAAMGIVDRNILDRWQRRTSAGAFPHEGGAHPGLSCTSCHIVSTMNTSDPKTLKVAVKSCGGNEGCHVTTTSDEGGALNFEIDQRKAKADFQCTKCHLVFGAQSVPASHLGAIPTPAKK